MQDDINNSLELAIEDYKSSRELLRDNFIKKIRSISDEYVDIYLLENCEPEAQQEAYGDTYATVAYCNSEQDIRDAEEEVKFCIEEFIREL